MSIINEIERLQSAKQDVKLSIEKRGVPVSTEDTLSVYAQKVDSAPFAARGTFTPEEDTIQFTLRGLGFEPKTVVMGCLEYDNNAVANSIELVVLWNGGFGGLRYRNDDLTRAFASIGIDSSVVVWYNDGVKITVSQTQGEKFFKAGYTYEYFVSGGFAQ